MGITAAGVAAAASVASAGSSIIGGMVGKGGASQGQQISQDQQAQMRADLLPYIQTGQNVLPDLQSIATSGPNAGGPNYIDQAAGIRPDSVFTQSDLEKTPGYQFTRDQGLKATQSAAAARGLGVSGAALKGAAAYATGLADRTYANRFNEAQTAFSDVLGLNTAFQGNTTNAYNRLLGTATLGGNAAAQVGTQGTTSAANQANSLLQGAQAQGTGLAGAGNALAGGVNNYLSNRAFQSGTTTGYPSGYVSGTQNNSDLIPAGGMNPTGNTWYNQ
jgi:hypothetical protein